jgi:hypothetical protein
VKNCIGNDNLLSVQGDMNFLGEKLTHFEVSGFLHFLGGELTAITSFFLT